MSAGRSSSTDPRQTGFSIVVPVYNESARIEETSRYLLDGLARDVEVVFVCNGCTDDSEKKLHSVVRNRAKVISCGRGKALAIREGERHLEKFPRFYVDADVLISGHAISVLADELKTLDLMLVSPVIEYDLSETSWASRLVQTLWLDLPHGRHGAFHHVLGVSAEGRACWQDFPNLIADDSFIEAMIPMGRKRISATQLVLVRPPRTLRSFIMVRARWSQGQRQLVSRGLAAPRTRGQKRALFRFIFFRPVAVTLYGVAKIAGCLIRRRGYDEWYTDQTSR